MTDIKEQNNDLKEEFHLIPKGLHVSNGRWWSFTMVAWNVMPGSPVQVRPIIRQTKATSDRTVFIRIGGFVLGFSRCSTLLWRYGFLFQSGFLLHQTMQDALFIIIHHFHSSRHELITGLRINYISCQYGGGCQWRRSMWASIAHDQIKSCHFGVQHQDLFSDEFSFNQIWRQKQILAWDVMPEFSFC